MQRRAGRRNVAGPQYSGGPKHCQPSMHHLVYRLADRVASAILPPHCVLCGAAGAGRARDLCAGCEADLPWLEDACPRCGLSLDGGNATGPPVVDDDVAYVQTVGGSLIAIPFR